MPKYPIYVPTMGRSHYPLTIKFLLRDHVPFKAVVREPEYEEYLKVVGHKDRLLVLPDEITKSVSVLETRQWIRQHAEQSGAERHWEFDDNIRQIKRLYHGRRIPCEAGPAIRCCEDFTDRYTNIGVSGMCYEMFAPKGTPTHRKNVHVYSAMLINHSMPCDWRLTYNEDTDLCLQALTSGWATLQVNTFLIQKMRTMIISGGNTDVMYKGDGRMQMARMLEKHWPEYVKVYRRFGREQHTVDWPKFRSNPPFILRDDIDLDSLPRWDEYGLELKVVKPLKHPALVKLLAEYNAYRHPPESTVHLFE